MEFVHPAIGTVTLLFSMWILSRGLVAQRGIKASTVARRRHKRWAPWAFAAMVASGVSGAASTLWLRPDLTLGETWHLVVGLGSITVMGVAGLLTRAFTRDPRLRKVHPLIGILSVALGVLQGILGIQLLP